MFQFIHAADLHLDSPLKGLERYEGAPVDEMRGATRRALENLVDLALEQAVDFLLIAGDLYDGDWKDHNTGLFFISQMVRLRDAGIPVVMISGNHDAANRMTRSLRLPDNVDLLPHGGAETSKLKQLQDLGVAVHGRSFAKQAEFDNFVVTYPDRVPGLFNIGLLHTSLTGCDGHEPYAPCTPDDLAQKQYDYWALGHVHNRTLPASGTSPVIFPGNLQGRNIRETDAKGCYLVRVNDKHETALEFRPVDVARWVVCPVPAGEIRQFEDLLNAFSTDLLRLCEAHPGLPVAARVRVTAAPELFQQYQCHTVEWKNQIRATALEASGGTAWIEKILFEPAVTVTTPSIEGALEGPLGELRKHLAEIRDDEAKLLELATELADLSAKLPGELTRGDDALDIKDPVQLKCWLTDVEALLLHRLTEGGRS